MRIIAYTGPPASGKTTAIKRYFGSAVRNAYIGYMHWQSHDWARLKQYCREADTLIVWDFQPNQQFHNLINAAVKAGIETVVLEYYLPLASWPVTVDGIEERLLSLQVA